MRRNALIQLTTLPSEDALNKLYYLVELIADKSKISTTSAKIKLLITHKAVWTKLLHDFRISPSMAVAYTYRYFVNPSLVAMVEEVISERTKEIAIAVVQPDSAPIQLTSVSKTKKSSAFVAKLNSSNHTEEFNYDAIWR